MSGIAIITEACIGMKDRACVDVCPVQCIYEFDPAKDQLFSEEEAGSGEIENTHPPNPDTSGSSATDPVREPGRVHVVHRVLPAGRVPGGRDLFGGGGPRRHAAAHYNSDDPNKGHDHSFFIQLSREVFAD